MLPKRPRECCFVSFGEDRMRRYSESSLKIVIFFSCVEMLLNEQIRRYNEKMEEIEQLEYAEALAVNQLKLKRKNTVHLD